MLLFAPCARDVKFRPYTTPSFIILFIIANIEESMLATFDEGGEHLERIDFLQDDPTVRGWHERDPPLIEQANAESAGRTEMIKTYFQSLQPVGDARVGSAVVPSAEEFRERGYEYWILDLERKTGVRYAFPRLRLGYRAVGGGPVYALDQGDGGIYEVQLP